MQDGQTVFFQAASKLEPGLRQSFEGLTDAVLPQVQEIRLMLGLPVQIRVKNRIVALPGAKVTARQLNDSLLSLCGDSVHSHQRELAAGYLSIEGGHRAGFAATAVYDAGGRLNGLRNVTAIVIRIARSFEGVSRPLIKMAFFDGIGGLIIAGAPSSGKTTLLRDMAARLAAGAVRGCDRVAVIDERGELGQCGGCTVLRGYDKAQGMLIAVRNLSPQAILCDEIGGLDEARAVEQALNSGAYVITTVHAASREQLLRRPVSRALLQSGAFKRAAILSEYPEPCSIKEVFDCDALLYQGAGHSDGFGKLLVGGDDEGAALPRKAVSA